ncbi:Guanine/hypoxanthine permease PbuG [Apilactobacillus kunkeei]|nr:Guanine/hypoxanthine permease PbuG [Apilactobacillus kunkeei]
MILTAFKLRETIIDAIPADLKSAIAGGIGLFIAFLGLNQGGLVVADKSTLVTLGSLHVGSTWLTIFGLILTVVLMSARVPAAIFISMVATTILGMVTGLIALPTHVVASVPSIKPIFLTAISHVTDINTLQLWIVVFTFLLVTFFDTTGTLVGLAKQAGFIKDNKIPRIGRALGSDSLAMVGGSLLGSSPMGAFVESSAGIAVGGRSGFTVIVTGIFFLLGTFFSPLLGVITDQVTAPALIVIGILMANALRDIHWDKFELAAPSFLIVLGMPLTYSISDGIALGFIVYPISMLAAKRGKEVHPLMYVLGVIFIIFFWLLNE